MGWNLTVREHSHSTQRNDCQDVDDGAFTDVEQYSTSGTLVYSYLAQMVSRLNHSGAELPKGN
jgi:hypothetical protein